MFIDHKFNFDIVAANPSKESLDEDVGVGMNPASGIGGVAIVFHGFHPRLFLLNPYYCAIWRNVFYYT